MSLATAPQQPKAGLVLATNGNFYGTTSEGGLGFGTVFKVTPTGEWTWLASFNSTNGNTPFAGLVQASDGNFYGTTQFGGTNGNYGTVFKMTPGGTLTTLHSFNNTNGAYPRSALVQGRDGNLYGTTEEGGMTNAGPPSTSGTVFRIVFTPPSVTSISQEASGAASLQFSGSPGFPYDTEASTNLMDWLFLTNHTAGTNGLFQLIDPDAPSYQKRFYRAIYK